MCVLKFSSFTSDLSIEIYVVLNNVCSDASSGIITNRINSELQYNLRTKITISQANLICFPFVRCKHEWTHSFVVVQGQRYTDIVLNQC